MTDHRNDYCHSCSSTTAETTKKCPTEPSIPYNHFSEFRVPKMDCPSKEAMIRIAFDDVEPSVSFMFDTPNRIVKIFHVQDIEFIEQKMHSVGLGALIEKSRAPTETDFSQFQKASTDSAQTEGHALKWLLIINAIMFVVEISTGWLAQSTGLIADSLDMFADAAVYGIALFVVGYSAKIKLRAAHFSGWLQLLLALGALTEVIRRFIFDSEPVSTLMMIMGMIALLANIACLLIIHQHKDKGAHMKASWIFSANDVIANLGVILAGILVAWSGSRYPDLVIGLIISIVVLSGAYRILKLRL